MLHSFRKSTNIFFSNDKYAINYLYIAHFIKRRDAKTRRTIFEEAKFTEFYPPFAFSKLKTLRFCASAFDNILRFSHHRQEFVFVHYRNVQSLGFLQLAGTHIVAC